MAVGALGWHTRNSAPLLTLVLVALLAGCADAPSPERPLRIEVSPGFPAETVVPLEAGDGKPLLVEGPADAWSSQGGALLFEDSTFGTIRLHRSTEEVVRYQVTFRDPACRGAIVVRGETHAFNVGVSGEISKAFPDVSLRADAPCEGAFQMSFGGFAPSRAPTHPATVPDVA